MTHSLGLSTTLASLLRVSAAGLVSLPSTALLSHQPSDSMTFQGGSTSLPPYVDHADDVAGHRPPWDASSVSNVSALLWVVKARRVLIYNENWHSI